MRSTFGRAALGKNPRRRRQALECRRPSRSRRLQGSRRSRVEPSRWKRGGAGATITRSQVATGDEDRDQGEVVVAVDLDVDLELASARSRAAHREVPQRAQRARVSAPIVVRGGALDAAIVPSVELGVEERCDCRLRGADGGVVATLAGSSRQTAGRREPELDCG